MSPIYEGPKPEWMEHGACVGLPTDIFYPEKGVTAPEAKRVCSGCVVRAACLEYALANIREAGIWGGTSEIERRTIRRRGRRERAAARTRLDTP